MQSFVAGDAVCNIFLRRRRRGSLARGLCEAENWRGATGEFCTSSARKLLPRLADALGVHLPAAKSTPFGAYAPSTNAIVDVSVSRPVKDLGHLSGLRRGQIGSDGTR